MNGIFKTNGFNEMFKANGFNAVFKTNGFHEVFKTNGFNAIILRTTGFNAMFKTNGFNNARKTSFLSDAYSTGLTKHKYNASWHVCLSLLNSFVIHLAGEPFCLKIYQDNHTVVLQTSAVQDINLNGLFALVLNKRILKPM